jgi:predicted nucleic acid-binding protein
MNVWALDTSVLVAALLRRHPAHDRCQAVLRRADAEGVTLAICAHAVAETFSVLCRLPLSPPLAPSDAETLIEREIVARCRILPVHAELSRQAVRACVAIGRGGGLVHDALHVVCARQAGASLLWTLNARDFTPLWDATHVQAP